MGNNISDIVNNATDAIINSSELDTARKNDLATIIYNAANRIIEAGGGGGGGDVTGVKGDAESTYRKGNVNITPANIGLGNVDNTSDANKPVSTAQQTALNGKVDKVAGKDLSENDYTDTDKAIVDGVTTALSGKVDKVTGKGLSTNDYTNADKDIVDGVTSGLASKVNTSSVGVANGVAELDANGRVPSAQLPSYVDDTVEGYLNSQDDKFYADSSYTTEIAGETGKIYVTLDTNKTYRWSGSGFVEISESLALGETSSTAYAGNKGKANADAINGMLNGTSLDSFGDVEDAINEINGKIGSYEVIASVTGDGVKTYSDAIDELIPYTSQSDLFIDDVNMFYPRNNVVYSSMNISSSGTAVLYGLRFDADKVFKAFYLSAGTATDLLNNVIAEDRVLKLCKRL